MEDSRIVEMYLERDEEAVSETKAKYGARLCKISFGITSDAGISEECENDTYVRAWNSIPPNEPAAYLFAFLARIIRNISIDRVRENTAMKRSAELTELDGELEECVSSPDGVEDAMNAEMLADAVSRFLSGLSKEKRVMFVRRYFYLDTVREISRRWGISESKVKTSLFRIRNDLREYLIKEGYAL